MIRKVCISLIVLALVCFSYGGATRWNIDGRPTADWFSGQESTKNLPLQWMRDIDALVSGGVSGPIADTGGTIFYCDGNMSADTGDGLSWASATQMLSTALALSHADIAVSADRQWAGRNRIYVKGDAITEDLTALAQKTDIIGVGNNNPYNMPGIVGNHDIASTTAYPSCRFYNIQFYGDEAAELWDVDGQGGLEFHGCLFQPNGSATVGLEASECTRLVVNGCQFVSIDGIDFSSSAIEIPDDTTPPPNMRFTNNLIRSDGIGINIDETVTSGSYISDNTFTTGGMCIDDEGDDVWVINNNMVCLTYGKAAFDFNVAKSQNNILTTPVRTTPIPYTNECAGAVAAAQRGAFGTIYYVDGNVSASGGDGLTWETAMQSLTTAMAASHANIAVSAQRNWAARNTIYVRCDAITEDQTTMAQKTDIVGVGSHNSYAQATLIGTWAIADTTSYMGCRFYNLQFYDDGAGGVLWDVDTQSGIEFHECIFHQNSTDTIGLLLEECINVEVDNCRFTWTNQNGWSTAAIQVVQDTDTATGIRITNNIIMSNAIGIDWNETANVDCWIIGNYIRSGTMLIDTDDSTNVNVLNNVGSTALAEADGTSYDFNILYAAGNVFTGSDETNTAPKIANNNE